jgi:signal transduction histidine kinase
MSTILIIEDNDLNLKLARDLLQLAGYRTLEAEDAELGISLAKQHRPNLILMDMFLPNMDGYEATRLLKDDPELADVPIIAFTALAMVQEKQKALASGCCGLISKPIDVESFTDTISSYLNGNGTVLKSEPVICHTGERSQKPARKASEQDIEEFFMIASHDLQAPLRKIDQFTSLLKRSTTSQISPDDLELLERIERATENMHELISDMLTLSRVSRRGGPFREVDLIMVVEEAIRDNQGMIDKLGATIELGAMARLSADPVQLQQLLQILIENGLKFHRENTAPVLRINSTMMSGVCEISVADNGLGFSEEYAEKIMQPFVRLHGASSKYSGRGMGLAIASKIVQRHQGQLRVNSCPGEGSIFTVLLPAGLNSDSAS